MDFIFRFCKIEKVFGDNRKF